MAANSTLCLIGGPEADILLNLVLRDHILIVRSSIGDSMILSDPKASTTSTDQLSVVRVDQLDMRISSHCILLHRILMGLPQFLSVSASVSEQMKELDVSDYHRRPKLIWIVVKFEHLMKPEEKKKYGNWDCFKIRPKKYQVWNQVIENDYSNIERLGNCMNEIRHGNYVYNPGSIWNHARLIVTDIPTIEAEVELRSILIVTPGISISETYLLGRSPYSEGIKDLEKMIYEAILSDD